MREIKSYSEWDIINSIGHSLKGIEISIRYFAVATLTLLFIGSSSYGSGNELISDAEFFASLSLESTNLEEVKTALEQGDTLDAREKLHAYYMQRTGVNYFPLSTGGDIDEANDNLDNYFTVVDIELYVGNEDGSINWEMAHSSDDEWHWQFHRMNWLINLARVYQKTSNEIYGLGWVAHLTDWARNNEAGYPRSLDTGNRLRNWVESYQYMVHLLKTPSLETDDHIDILKSIMQQARFLRDNWKPDSNWGASETRGLNEVVVMFPEFNFYPGDSRENWINLVQERLLYHLNETFLDDGVQFETSPMYHYLTYRNLLVAYQLMRINDISASDEFDSLYILPAEYMMHITRPDGYIPQIADSDKTDRHLYYLGIAAEIYDRDDFRYVASRGSNGLPPEDNFKVFPFGKNIVMRSSWGNNPTEMKNAKYLAFNYSTNIPWHAHFDMLSIEAVANGKNIVIDPGRYTYSEDDDWRVYFKNTSAHNTVVVNDQNQKSFAAADAQWASMPGFDYINAQHDSYTLRQQEVNHRRKVFFIKPDFWMVADVLTGIGSHTFDLYYHMDPMYNSNHTFNNVNQVISTADFAIAPSNTDAHAEIIDGWVSFSYGSKSAAPILKYSKEGALPQTFETVLYPFQGTNQNIDISNLLPIDASGNAFASDQAVTVKVMNTLGFDLVGLNHSLQEQVFVGRFSYEGEAMHVKVDSEDKILQYNMVKGKYLLSDGVVVMNAGTTPVDLSFTGSGLSVEGEAIAGFRAWAPGVTDVKVNGEPVTYQYEDDYVLFGIVPTSIQSPASRIQTPVTLEQNYPNPFSGSTSIAFTIARNSRVKITLYNSSGRIIQTILDEQHPAGKHSFVFSNQTLEPGIYFYKLETDLGAIVKKMSVVK